MLLYGYMLNTILKSRTIQLAVAQAVASVLIAIFTELDMVSVALAVKSIADILLRLDTTTPLK